MEELYIDRTKFDAVWGRVTGAGAVNRTSETVTITPSASLPGCCAADPCENAAHTHGNARGYIAGNMANNTSESAAELIWFMDITAFNARLCRAVMQKCPGRHSKTLQCVADDERRHLKKLRAEYFILTGCAYCPEDVRPAVCTVSGTLRTLCANLSRCAQEYQKAAASAPTALACTYGKFASDELCNAESITCLLESMI